MSEKDKMEIYLKLLTVLFFVVGFLSVMGGVFGIVTFKSFDIPKIAFERFFFFRHYLELASFNIILGISILISAFYFFKRRQWARTFFEILAWFILLNIIILFLIGVITITSNPDNPFGFKMVGLVMTFIVCGIYGGINIFVLYVLRKKEFLELFSKRKSD